MINALSILACFLGMIASFVCVHRKLKAVYVLNFINGFVFTGLNASIALSAPGQEGVALMIVPSLWMVVTAVIGLRRLERKTATNVDV